jgi:hypothetical protein
MTINIEPINIVLFLSVVISLICIISLFVKATETKGKILFISLVVCLITNVVSCKKREDRAHKARLEVLPQEWRDINAKITPTNRDVALESRDVYVEAIWAQFIASNPPKITLEQYNIFAGEDCKWFGGSLRSLTKKDVIEHNLIKLE